MSTGMTSVAQDCHRRPVSRDVAGAKGRGRSGRGL